MGDEHQPLTDDGREWEFPSGKELGALLKAKRKETGLTYAQISGRIRISARYLEALENEDWDHLPSPAFIKGFIRSYARVLGLSEEGLIALYQETAPPSQPMPKPLQAAPKKKRGLFYLMLVFAVLAGGFAAFEWIGHPTLGGKTTKQGPTLPAEERSGATHIDPGSRLEKEEAPPNGVHQSPGPLETGRELPRKGPAPAPGPEETGSIDKAAGALQEREGTPSSSETVSSWEAETSVPDMAPVSENDMPPLILKANVKERTWVRVTIDGERPKEYIFDPESRPEWRAHKGFELLIGNAGGIDLEFKGKKMEDLGKRGQVIRLRLPSGDETSVSSD
jgi:cytoskeleton protein RodZ